MNTPKNLTSRLATGMTAILIVAPCAADLAPDPDDSLFDAFEVC